MKYTKEMDEFLIRQKQVLSSWNEIRNNFNAKFKTNQTSRAVRSRYERVSKELAKEAIKKPSEIEWFPTAKKIIEAENELELNESQFDLLSKAINEINAWIIKLNSDTLNSLKLVENQLEQLDLRIEENYRHFEYLDRKNLDSIRRVKKRFHEIEKEAFWNLEDKLADVEKRIVGQTGEYDLQAGYLNLSNSLETEMKIRNQTDDHIFAKIKRNRRNDRAYFDTHIDKLRDRLSELESKIANKAEIIPVEAQKEASPIAEGVESKELAKRLCEGDFLKLGHVLKNPANSLEYLVVSRGMSYAGICNMQFLKQSELIGWEIVKEPENENLS